MLKGGTILDHFKINLFYAGLSPEQFSQVKAPVREDNRRSLLIWSVCLSLFWIMSLFFALDSPAYASCRPVYIMAMAVCILTALGAELAGEENPRLLNLLILLFELSLRGAGLGIALCQPHDRTVSMIAFAIIAPTAFISRTVTDIALSALALAVYPLFAKGVLDPEVYSWGLTNLAIFSIAGILIGHFINRARYERFLYAESARTLADIQMIYAYSDQLTGLKNRRAYEEEVHRLSESLPPDLCLIMADLNGLKQTNDTLGHDAGDRLIEGAAKCLTSAFENPDTVYRIGGDEFCILMHGTREDVLCRLKKLEELTAGWSGSGLLGVSISCGFACSRDHADFRSMEAEADQNMYEAKRTHYETSGAER